MRVNAGRLECVTAGICHGEAGTDGAEVLGVAVNAVVKAFHLPAKTQGLPERIGGVRCSGEIGGVSRGWERVLRRLSSGLCQVCVREHMVLVCVQPHSVFVLKGSRMLKR